jgi:3-deoxy-D-manno-octulosonate 8-phosphate phosphatase (KDO 8-P phosphatase)
MNSLPDFSQIKGFVLDVDGVLTDGSVIVMENGDQVRLMNIKDGYALQLAVKCGYTLGIISGGRSLGVKHRLQGLGIQHIYMGSGEKLPVFQRFLETSGLLPHEVIYIGDDMPDIPVMQAAGISIAPADAANDVRKTATWVSEINGGKGCVREVIEMVMKAQGRWYASDSFIW